MAQLVEQHRVTDYDAWRKVCDEVEPLSGPAVGSPRKTSITRKTTQTTCWFSTGSTPWARRKRSWITLRSTPLCNGSVSLVHHESSSSKRRNDSSTRRFDRHDRSPHLCALRAMDTKQRDITIDRYLCTFMPNNTESALFALVWSSVVLCLPTTRRSGTC